MPNADPKSHERKAVKIHTRGPSLSSMAILVQEVYAPVSFSTTPLRRLQHAQLDLQTM
jgi:hypothetical protein